MQLLTLKFLNYLVRGSSISTILLASVAGLAGFDVRIMNPRVSIFFVPLLFAGRLVAGPTGGEVEFFESRIRPVLAQDCYECHSSTGKQKAGLVLDHREGLLKGGDTGPALVPGKADESLLIEALRHEGDLTMPKAGVKLDAAIIADFVKWIDMGAPDPRDDPPTGAELAHDTDWPAILERRKAWWSFQPITNPEVPDLAEHPVDSFIAAKLAEAGLAPAEPADPGVLCRRLYLTLIGLPPTPEQIDAFLDSGANVEGLIDELLASEHFGERWARHWMDWIRYAESHGSEGDPRIENAWFYRDYLIRALNADIPYDQLVREHVAGDLLDQPRINEELGINESVIATAHWRMVQHGFAPTDALDEKVRFTDDQINVFTQAFLGLTVSCARCHDHKFDAISQADYYALFGIFGSTRPGRHRIDQQDDGADRQRLTELKARLRGVLGDEWLTRVGQDEFPSEAEVTEAKEDRKHPLFILKQAAEAGKSKDGFEAGWRKFAGPFLESLPLITSGERGLLPELDRWFQYGDSSYSRGGDFGVALEGERVVERILPAGVYSNRLSPKDRAVLASPSVVLEGKYDLWLHVAGDHGASARYAVQNYPRSGTVYPVTTLKDGEWRWQKYDLDYWDGDSIHVELATARDAPLQVQNEDRSWFGLREARLLRKGEPSPEGAELDVFAALLVEKSSDAKSYAEVRGNFRELAAEAFQDWKRGTDAKIVEQLLEAGLLPNSQSALPEAANLVREYRDLEAKLAIPVRVPGLLEWAAADQPLYDRGDHKKPLDPVPRRFLDAIDSTPYETKQSGRLELAEDLFREDNSFTRRVIVNRVWVHLFGRGLVSTPDNLGRLGEAPSHPELLDHLATRFEHEDAWSLKSLIKYLVMSQTWRQSSNPKSDVRDPKEVDPENRLLSHFSVRRLEAEAIRDSILAVSGNLDPAVGGAPANGGSNRRSVYVEVIRNRLDPFLTAFGAPEPFSATGARPVTNVPAQSLTMMNDGFVVSAANRFAGEVANEPDDAARIDRMWLTALGRRPSDAERAGASGLLEELRQRYGSIQTELAKLNGDAAKLDAERQSILTPIRDRLLAEAEKDAKGKPAAAGPEPFAFWDFENGFEDQIGDLDGKAMGSARVEGGALVVDGKGMVVTSPVGNAFKSKTLEVLVLLDDLNQKAGGAMTVQDLQGNLFDSIVFAERQPRRWMPGSNGFSRTEDFRGTDETEAADTPVRIAIAYDEDGTIRGYRNGQPYGEPVRKSGLQAFAEGKTQVAFGIRHGTGVSPGRMLNGRILEAKLYDRALEPDEIAAAAGASGVFGSLKHILAALTESQKTRLAEIETEIAKLRSAREALGKPAGEIQVWSDLAHSILNLKEFIYVR